jgi:hypothetical protein
LKAETFLRCNKKYLEAFFWGRENVKPFLHALLVFRFIKDDRIVSEDRNLQNTFLAKKHCAPKNVIPLDSFILRRICTLPFTHIFLHFNLDF